MVTSVSELFSILSFNSGPSQPSRSRPVAVITMSFSSTKTCSSMVASVVSGSLSFASSLALVSSAEDASSSVLVVFSAFAGPVLKCKDNYIIKTL